MKLSSNDYMLQENIISFKVFLEASGNKSKNLLDADIDDVRKLIKDLQFIEMQKHLMECSKTYGIKEIKGCIAWINDGHGFWNNPFGVQSINGSEANYLEALHCLIKK